MKLSPRLNRRFHKQRDWLPTTANPCPFPGTVIPASWKKAIGPIPRTLLLEGIRQSAAYFRNPGDAIERGIAMVPEDRKKHGVFLKLSLRDNILMSSMKKCLRGIALNKRLQKQYCGEYEKKLDIKCSSVAQICQDLSGGNQQKVAVSRVLSSEPDIIILDEPTRGIDVKTKSEIHRLMSELACTGKAVLLVSSELPEILGMSDRILVLHEGIMTGILGRHQATAARIMELAVQTTKMGA